MKATAVPNDAKPQLFTAILIEGDHEIPLGTVAIDAAGLVRILDSAKASAAAAGKLQRMVDEVNAKKIVHIDVPPREGAPEFTLASAIIKRGDPRFVSALLDYALTYYGIELREPRAAP